MPPVPNQPEKSVPPTPATPSELKQIRTYQGDIADALARQNESLYSIQAKEHAKTGGPTGESVKSAAPLFVGALLLLTFAGVGSYLAYSQYVEKTAPPPPTVLESQFLSPESTAEVDISSLSRDALIIAITEKLAEAKPGELRQVILRNGALEATTTPFLAALGTQAPGSLVRALGSAFMVGSLGESHFLIFKLSSFPSAFGGMLEWENALASDLGPLFDTNLVKSIGPASVFKDVVYKNKDARVLYAEVAGEAGATNMTPALLYSFFDNKMLIITDQLDVLQTLIDRLMQENLAR